MRVPLSWLREYVPLTMPVPELSHRMLLAGVEVESVERSGGDWDRVYVGEIIRLERHPNADRLQLATVSYGQATETVVTGAPNIAVGDRVPFALVGAELIDMHQDPPKKSKLKPSKIRGIESAGMVCSAAELGLGEDHAGILILDKDAPVGLPLADVFGDTVLVLKLTPNRSDCLSIVGVAHEVAALTGQRAKEPPTSADATGPKTADRVAIEIEDADLCRRYSAAIVEGVTIGPSPQWLQDRLNAAGLRPINNVVDVTNYVMWELGQPLHAFDFEHIRQRRIVVRAARPGERLRTLDGADRELTPDMLVIADGEGSVAIAGVMGGEDSEVSASTTSVLLESANFSPTSVRRTARALRLPSEASRRFEKGLPPELTTIALARAAQLIKELAGGEIGTGWADNYPVPEKPRAVTVPMGEFERLLGTPVSAPDAIEVLGRLGFGAEEHGGHLHVDVPHRRVDVSIPADVVEEVARIRGYDALPMTMLSGAIPEPTPPDAPFLIDERVRDALVGCGFSETIAYSLTTRSLLDKLPAAPGDGGLAAQVDQLLMPESEPIRIVNPLTSEMEVLRTTPFPQILGAVRDNLRWTDRDVMLFEIGRIYLGKPGKLPEERRVLTLATGAYGSGPGWGSRVELDFFDLKGVLETLLDRLGVPGATYQPITHPAFRKGRCAAVMLTGRRGATRVLGVIGEVAPIVRRGLDLDQPAYLAGLSLDELRATMTDGRAFEPLARFPAVYQDLAVVVADTVTAEDLRRTIMRAGRPLVVEVQLFDLYRGEGIGPGRRSLAYRITYQSPERTLTDQEVAATHARLEDALQRTHGAEIRGRAG